jgi:hypothetical protein
MFVRAQHGSLPLHGQAICNLPSLINNLPPLKMLTIFSLFDVVMEPSKVTVNLNGTDLSLRLEFHTVLCTTWQLCKNFYLALIKVNSC